MRKTLLFVMIVLFLATLACGTAAVVPVTLAPVAVQPTLTPYPTQVPTLAPTLVPAAPVQDTNTLRVAAIAALSNNGFVRDESLDSNCSTQCEGYSNGSQVDALVYDNGGFGIVAIVNSNSDATAQAQAVFYVVKAIYGADVVTFVANSFSDMGGTAGSRNTVIDGFGIEVSILYSNGNALMIVAIIPAATAPASIGTSS